MICLVVMAPRALYEDRFVAIVAVVNAKSRAEAVRRFNSHPEVGKQMPGTYRKPQAREVFPAAVELIYIK